MAGPSNPLVPAGESNFAKEWVQRYQDAKRLRMPLEADWRKVAEWGLPRQFSGWTSTNAPMQNAGTGQARQARQNTYDSTLTRTLPIYGAVLDRILTPQSQMWHTLQPEDERARKSRTVQLGLEKLNNLLFRRRYEWMARFTQAQSATYLSHGAYGNAGKIVTWRPANRQLRTSGGFLYRNIPFRNLFWEIDDEDQIRTKFRRIDWNARQALKALGDRTPRKLREIAEGPQASAQQDRTYEFVHCISPRQDFDEYALDQRSLPYGSYYVFVDEPECVKDGGFSSDPIMISRTATEGGSPYGYGPAQTIISTVGVANAQVKTLLRAGQLSAQPALLVRDDGVMNVELTPGAQISGGVDSQGRRMVYPVEQGNFQLPKELLAQERDDMREALFGRIFEILRDQPQKTATEVLDMAAREAAHVAPVMGGMQADDLGPMIEREIHLLAENNALPEDLPPELQELKYVPVYTSPMAKAQHAESVSGFMRISDVAMNFAKMTGDTRPVRQLNMDVALPEIAHLMSVPPSWLKSEEELQASDAEAQRQQEVATAVEALPAAASVAKTMADNNMKPGAE